jgi:hypothetical protein
MLSSTLVSPTTLLLSLLLLLLLLEQHAEAWTTPPPSRRLTTSSSRHVAVERTRLFMATINQEEVAARIIDTDRGRSTSPSEQDDLELYFAQLEETYATTLQAPARSPFVQGSWVVEYTTAPPPSNGQLGPFRGIAYQEVDLESGRYANILRVDDWLTATLEATWVEWDGVLIEDTDSAGSKKWTGKGTSDDDDETVAETSEQKSNPSFMDALSGVFASSPATTKSEDYGATCWVVTFETITIRVFGIPLINQKFNNVKRVWRTTYVDENTRIVRAGRTGKQDDEMLFYMTRAE